jgi:hypothetical protein
MPLMDKDSLQRRILDHLQDHYPVSTRQLAAAMRLPEKRVLRELRIMETKGYVELDVLPDIIYVRCLVVTSRAPTRDENAAGTVNDGKKGGAVKGKKDWEGGEDPAYL